MRAILFFLASGLIWGLLELSFDFTLRSSLVRLITMAKHGGL